MSQSMYWTQTFCYKVKQIVIRTAHPLVSLCVTFLSFLMWVSVNSSCCIFSILHFPALCETFCSSCYIQSIIRGAGIAQWLECWTHDWKVMGSNPCWSGGKIFFSRVDFLCWLLFRYPFHPCVTAVARKRSWSFCQKCRWQVTAKHAYTLHMWFAWSDMEHGCMVYTGLAPRWLQFHVAPAMPAL